MLRAATTTATRFRWRLTKRWWWRLLLIAAICGAVGGGCAWVIWKQTVNPPSPQSRAWLSLHNTATLVTSFGRGVAGIVHGRYNLDDKRYAAVMGASGMIPWACLMVGWFVARDIYLRKRLTKPKGIIEVSHDERQLLSRRRLLFDAGSGAGALATAAVATKALRVDPWQIKARNYTVAVPNLPASLNNLRLIQLSDMHLGPRVSAEFINECAQIALNLKPDVLLLTGDFNHKGVRYREQVNACVDAMMLDKFDCPKFGVLGNHDWYGQGQITADTLASRGVRMLDNTRVFLDANRELRTRPPKEEALCFAGLADYLEAVIDPRAALADCPDHVPTVLLSHNPDTCEDPMVLEHATKIALQVSGHTHGGQVRIPLIGTPLIPSRYKGRYAGGMMQGPRFPVVVSRGIGTSLLPIRFNVPAEVVQITLIKA
ncbi:MAG: metallophosphoesterase [Phycisphaerae bacterium]